MKREEQQDVVVHRCRSILNSQEVDMLNLGTVLHENVAQELYAIRVSLQRFILNNGRTEEIDNIKKMLNSTISEVQQIANNLLPTVLRDFGFVKAIEDLISQRKNKKTKFIIRTDRNVDELSIHCQLHLYRLIKAYLQNTSLYIEISIIDIKIKMMKEILILEVFDNRVIDHSLNAWDTNEQFKIIKNSILYFNGMLEIQHQTTGLKLLITLKIDVNND